MIILSEVRRDFLVQCSDKVYDDLSLFLGQPILFMSESNEYVAGPPELLDFNSHDQMPLSFV